MKQKILQIVSVAAFLVVLVFNYLAATGSLNDTATSAISDKYPTQITPAGYAFTIWSLIYLGLAAFTIYQALPSKTDDPFLSKIRPLFLFNCAANSAWLVAWHFDLIPISLVVMVILLISLAMISDAAKDTGAGADTFLVRAPFNLYFGWVTVATILNSTILFVSSGYASDSASGPLIGAALIMIAGILGVFIRFRLNAFWYPLAGAWGTTAIAVKQSGNTAIVVAAAVAVVILLFAALWGAVRD